MAAITGIDGSVTYAAGWVTNAHYFRIKESAIVRERTPFAPAGNARQRDTGLRSWEGEYRCWQAATVNTDLAAASGYATNAHAYSIELVADDLLTTPFGATFQQRIAGLIAASGSYDCYLDSVTPLPTAGDTDTLTLTIDAGLTFTIPTVIADAESRASSEGADRHVVITWSSSGAWVSAGVPIIGTSGAATFVAEGGREYSGTILVTRIGINLTAQREIAEWTFGFVGNGAGVAA